MNFDFFGELHFEKYSKTLKNKNTLQETIKRLAFSDTFVPYGIHTYIHKKPQQIELRGD